MTVAVKMEEISKSFGAVKAVQDVTAEFAYGEVTGLLGDNAAGKSTLMKVLSGVYVPDRGNIYIDGTKANIKTPLDARKLGVEMIYQDLALVPYLDVPSNIFLGREIASKFGKLSQKEMRKQSWDILNRLGYEFDEDSIRREASYFSGGQQQAIAIARSFLFKPKILILDEPTASLGVKGRDILHRFMTEFKKEDSCMIYITHRLPDVFAIADKIMTMRRGKIVDVKATADTSMERTIRIMIGVDETD
jgi:ABC-type sugar transport system ATPase subunit